MIRKIFTFFESNTPLFLGCRFLRRFLPRHLPPCWSDVRLFSVHSVPLHAPPGSVSRAFFCLYPIAPSLFCPGIRRISCPPLISTWLRLSGIKTTLSRAALPDLTNLLMFAFIRLFRIIPFLSTPHLSAFISGDFFLSDWTGVAFPRPVWEAVHDHR